MMLIAEDGDTNRHIEELMLALPIEALKPVIEQRERKHQKRSHIRRRLELLRALQMENEAA